MRENLGYDGRGLQEMDRKYVLHPWMSLESAGKSDALMIAEARGVYIHDTDGNRYLDGIGGMWCVNIGHGREEMAHAVADQIRRMPYYSAFGTLGSPPASELAARLAALAPGDLDTVFFTTGGSTANDSAIRFLHLYFNLLGKPHKKHIITRRDAYHGSTYLTASISGKKEDRSHFDFISDTVHHLSAPNPYRRPAGMSLEAFCDDKVAELEHKILKLGPDNVACFIAEPILAAGGVIVPPPGYQARTLEVCRKYDVVYLCDEVVTGFGRLGHIFASEPEFGIVPDILTCAKGLTSGYVPLGAVLLSRRLYERVCGAGAQAAMFTNGFTYSGHPVACAAALKNLDILEREDLCGHVRKVGPYFQQQLAELRDLPIVGDVRGHQLVACVECVADKETKAPMASEVQIGKRIDAECQARGLILRPLGHLCVLSPPLTISEAEIDRMVAIMREAIEAAAAGVRSEGLWSG